MAREAATKHGKPCDWTWESTRQSAFTILARGLGQRRRTRYSGSHCAVPLAFGTGLLLHLWKPDRAPNRLRTWLFVRHSFKWQATNGHIWPFSLAVAISGDSVAHDRLASCLQKTIRWYSSAATLLAVFLLTAGSYFFSTHHHAGDHVVWRIPVVCRCAGGDTYFSVGSRPFLYGRLRICTNVARVRLAQAVTGSSALHGWPSELHTMDLFAPAMIISGNASIAFIWLLQTEEPPGIAAAGP